MEISGGRRERGNCQGDGGSSGHAEDRGRAPEAAQMAHDLRDGKMQISMESAVALRSSDSCSRRPAASSPPMAK